MTVTTDFKALSDGFVLTTSGTLSVLTGDFITIAMVFADNPNATSWTVTNTGTAIVWTKQVETNVGSNCKAVLWTGTAGATPPTTVTVTVDTGVGRGAGRGMYVAVHSGQHATTPLPAGNIFSGTGGTDVSQAITPTSSGSALHMIAGDWSATNSFVAIANCSLVAAAVNIAGELTAAAFKPTTQPRTDAVAFTIGETDTSGKISWIAWEVQAAPSNRPLSFRQNRGLRPAPFRPGLARLTTAQKDRHNGPAYRTVLDRAA